jgi:poly(hydroxyalkanoate) granule-associated protein
MQTGTMIDKPMESVNALRQNLTEAGKNVWLAGLGVVATVDKEGRRVFGDLVEKGKALDIETPPAVAKAIDQAAEQVKAVRNTVETTLTDASRAVLHRMGLPTHDEIQALIARVEQLTTKVEAIGKKEAR